MTNAQFNKLLSVAGGLDGAMAAAEKAGFEMVKFAGKSAKIADLMSISNADASAIITSLEGIAQPVARATRYVSGGDCSCAHCLSGNESLCRRDGFGR